MGRTKSSEGGSLFNNVKRGNQKYGIRLHGTPMKTGFDGLADSPWRKTPSIFKQPVTLVHTTSRETQKTPIDLSKKLSAPAATIYRNKMDKPKQVFWAKSLEGLRAMIPLGLSDRLDVQHDSFIEQHLALASKIEPILTVLNEEAVAATLCSALQLSNGSPIIGQQATKKQIGENPLAALNFSQPLVQIPTITEQDIIAQEKRVLDARSRLTALRNTFVER